MSNKLSTKGRMPRKVRMTRRDKVAPQARALALVDQAELNEDQDGAELSDRERRFVDAYVSGTETAGRQDLAAIAAGYSETSARTSGARVAKYPRVRIAIDAALRHAIGTDLTVEAVNVIRTIIRDPEASLKLRGDMAAKVIEYSGLVERTKLQKAEDSGLGGGKKLAEMTRAELEAVIAQGAAVLRQAGENEKTIEGAAHEARDDDELDELFDIVMD